MTGSKEGMRPAWAKDQEVTDSHSWGQGDPNSNAQKNLWIRKGGDAML